MGFRGADLNVVANNNFLQSNPAAAKLFEVMTIPLGDISKQNNRMNAGENTQRDIDAHAEEWMVASGMKLINAKDCRNARPLRAA